MATKKITLSEVHKKYLKIIAYLIGSGLLGVLLARIAGNQELAAIFTPAINFAIFTLEKELSSEGYIKALKVK